MKSKKITGDTKLLLDELSDEWWDKDGGFSVNFNYTIQ